LRDWSVIAMTTRPIPHTFLFSGALFTLLFLLIVELPEPLEDEEGENQPSESDEKPSRPFALNCNNGDDEDE
jgi:hypothetical protein